MEKLLVSGIKSGFGKFIYEQVGGEGLTRENANELIERLKMVGVKEIIHCAYPTYTNVCLSLLRRQINDSIGLTQRLVEIPHERFVFMSSVNVYPKDYKDDEDKDLRVDDAQGLYGITKLMCEAILIEQAKNLLILRCSSLLGKYSRRTSLKKIIEDEYPQITLTADSKLNIILYEDVLDFIKYSNEQRLNGIYNVASSKSISLKEIAGLFDKQVEFGNYTYEIPEVDARKLIRIFPAFMKTSEQNIEQYLKSELK